MASSAPGAPSEYDAVFGEGRVADTDSDLEQARRHFAAASRPYLSSPVPWLAWAIVLPGAALATDPVADRRGPAGVLALWSLAILLGGAVEAGYLLRARRRLGTSPLGAWTMTVQGNLSLIAVALSVVLLALDRPRLLPGLWLLLLGHSLFAFGGLGFRPLRTAGIVYQLAGAIALVPGVPEMAALALATGLGNLRVALGLYGRERGPGAAAGGDPERRS